MIFTRRRHVLFSMLAALAALTAACGGGGESGDDGGGASADVEAEADVNRDADVDADVDAEADAEPAGDFECPVTLADVEAAYAPIQFEDAEVGPDDCTFLREDEIGSVVIAVVATNATGAYASLRSLMPDAEEVDGVGDKASYSRGRTSLAAQVDGKVLSIMTVSMLGVGGVEDASSDELDENVKSATIELATKAAAEL